MSKFENYSYKDEHGEIHTITNIPTDEVNALQRSLRISHLEALDLWCCDNDKKTNPIQEALNAKAKGAGTGAKGARKTRNVKPDETKLSLISYLSSSLGEYAAIGDVRVTNAQGEIVFNVGDDEFKLKLSKSRKKA